MITTNKLTVEVEDPTAPSLPNTLLDIEFVHIPSGVPNSGAPNVEIAPRFGTMANNPCIHKETLIRPMAAVHTLGLNASAVSLGKLYIDVRPHAQYGNSEWAEISLETAFAVILACLRYPDIYDLDRIDKLYSSRIHLDGRLVGSEYDTLRDLLTAEFERPEAHPTYKN